MNDQNKHLFKTQAMKVKQGNKQKLKKINKRLKKKQNELL